MFNILWSGLILTAAFGLLFVVITRLDLFASGSESLDASGTESAVTDQGAGSSEPTSGSEEPSATVTGQGTPSSDSDPGVEGDPSPPAEGDGAAYAPIEVHVDVGAEDTEVSDQYVSSFFQIWPAPEAEGDLPPLATPKLSGGTFDIVLDFEAMMVSGSFDLAYEREWRRGNAVPRIARGVLRDRPWDLRGTSYSESRHF